MENFNKLSLEEKKSKIWKNGTWVCEAIKQKYVYKCYSVEQDYVTWIMDMNTNETVGVRLMTDSDLGLFIQ